MKQVILASLVLLTTLAGGGPLRGEEPDYPAWQPPVPNDGIERTAPGLLAMPRELRGWGVTLRRRATVQVRLVVFQYDVVPEEGAGPAPGTITVWSFREGGSAHAALAARLRQTNMSGTPWTRSNDRVDLRDLVYRRAGEYFVLFQGVVRHTHFTVQADVSRHAPGADRDRLVAATRDATRGVIAAIEAAGSALSSAPRTIGEVRLERIPHPSPHFPDSSEARLTVLPRAGQAGGVVSPRLVLFWRLEAEAPFWRGRDVHLSWDLADPAAHGRAQPISLQPRAADDARLELRLVRSHDEGAAYALEEIAFGIAEGARTATWKRPE